MPWIDEYANLDCGCHVAVYDGGIRVMFCSMHKAAPIMLSALTRMRKRIGFDSVTHWHTVDDPDVLSMNDAITKARQKHGTKGTN